MQKPASLVRSADDLHDLFTPDGALFTPRSWTNPYRPRVIVDRAFSLLCGVPGRSTQALERWLETLHAFSCDDWIAVARSGDACSPVEWEAARQAASDTITGHHLELTAWFIRDMISTAACVMTHGTGSTRRNRYQFARARAYADWAGLAIATRTWLSRRDYELLCSPFRYRGMPPLNDSTTRVRRPAAPSVVANRPLRFRARGD